MGCDLTNGRLYDTCSFGRAGIKAIFFVKQADYNALSGKTISDGEITSLGTDAIDIYQFEVGNNVGMFEEIQNISKENNTAFIEQRVVLSIGNIKGEDLADLNNLKVGRWTVFVQDFQNKIRAFGLTRGMTSSGGSDTSGVASGDRKGLEMSFISIEDDLAPFLADYTSRPFDNFANVTVEDGSGVAPPSGSITDAETLALIARMTAEGETPTEAQQLVLQTAIVKLKTDGVFSKLDAFYYRAVHGEESSKLNWIKNDHNSTYNGSYTFTAYEGVKGDGSSAYIDNDYIGTTDAVNMTDTSISVGYRLKVEGTVTARRVFGAIGSAKGYLTNLVYVAGSARAYIGDSNYNDGVTAHAINTNYGYTTADNGGTDYTTAYINGVETGSPRVVIIGAADGVADISMQELAFNNAGSPSGHYNGQIQFSFYGGELTETEHKSISDTVDYLVANYTGSP
jgi:hypothetical protein